MAFFGCFFCDPYNLFNAVNSNWCMFVFVNELCARIHTFSSNAENIMNIELQRSIRRAGWNRNNNKTNIEYNSNSSTIVLELFRSAIENSEQNAFAWEFETI